MGNALAEVVRRYATPAPRGMEHKRFIPTNEMVGQDPLTDWAIGVADRATHPVRSVANALTDLTKGSPEEIAMNLTNGGMVGKFIAHTPLKPGAGVGSRYTTSKPVDLIENTQRSLEDLRGGSIVNMPYDRTHANVRVSSISDEPVDFVTPGGQDFSLIKKNYENEHGGASNYGIANRIQNRVIQARKENLEKGGNGNVFLLPSVMTEGEGFSSSPTNALVQLIRNAKLGKTDIRHLNNLVRDYEVKGTYPFKDFVGVTSDDVMHQIRTGEGVGATPGQLRSAIFQRFKLKDNQERIGYNIEDLMGAITDPNLKGLPRGYMGNSIVKSNPDGKLTLSDHPDYSHNLPGVHYGTLGHSVPINTLMPDVFNTIARQTDKNGKRLTDSQVIGAMETRGENISQLVDDNVIENYNNYVKQARLNGLME